MRIILEAWWVEVILYGESYVWAQIFVSCWLVMLYQQMHEKGSSFKKSTEQAIIVLLYGQAPKPESPDTRAGAVFSSGYSDAPRKGRTESPPPFDSESALMDFWFRAVLSLPTAPQGTGRALGTGSSFLFFSPRGETRDSLPYFLKKSRTKKQMNSSKDSGIGKKLWSASWQFYEFNLRRGSEGNHTILLKRNGSNLSEIHPKLYACWKNLYKLCLSQLNYFIT